MSTFLATDVTELYQYNTGSADKVKTFRGYDKDGKYVPGSETQAKNADNDINLSDLNSAIKEAESSYRTEFNDAAKEVDALAKPTEDGLIISGLSLKWTVVDLATSVREANSSSIKKLWTIYNQATIYHSKKQKEYNEEAKARCRGYANVVRVKEV